MFDVLMPNGPSVDIYISIFLRDILCDISFPGMRTSDIFSAQVTQHGRYGRQAHPMCVWTYTLHVSRR